MRRSRVWIVIAGAALTAPATVLAQATDGPAMVVAEDPQTGPLLLSDVLRRSARTAPQIIEALARIRQAQRARSPR